MRRAPQLPGQLRPPCCGRRATRLLPGWLAALLLVLAGVPGRAAAPVRMGATATHLIDTWETEQGLPENSTRQVVQTSDGFLWFGTLAGLVRFDGASLKVFTPDTTPSLPSEGIVHLHLDRSQRLWISTLRGLVVSSPAQRLEFRRVAGWTGSYVRAAAENAGVICFTSFDGKVFRAAGDQFAELPQPPGNPDSTYHPFVDRRGRLSVVQGAFFGSWENGRWVESPLAAEATRDFRGAGPAQDGTLWVCTVSQLLRIDGDQIVSRRPLAAAIPPIWQLSEDSQGTVWLPTWGAGLYSVTQEGIVHRLTTANGLLSDSLRFVFEDREGSLWAGGGNGAGLMRMKHRTVQTLGFESGLPDRAVKAVIEDRAGRILVGTYGRGVVRFESGRWQPATGGDASGLYVQCLLAARDGRLWIGTFDRGVQVWTGEETQKLDSGDSGGRNVNSLFQDAQGRIWIGGNESMMLAEGGTFVRQTLAEGRRMPTVVGFAESTGDGTLWAANDSGLFRRTRDTWQEVVDGAGQAVRGIQCLRADADGTLWLGRTGMGLWRLRANRWTRFGEEHGLSARAITSLVDDGAGHLWLGSSRGLIRVAREALDRVANHTAVRLQEQIFTPGDGLASYEIAGGFSSTSLRDRSGRLWFATPRGVAVVDAPHLRLNAVPPPVLIDAVSYVDAAGQKLRLTPSAAVNLVLPPGSRKLEVHYAVPSLAAPEKVRLRHRFERDGSLVSEDEQTARVFQSDLLVPGEYVLTMMAANNDGLWNLQGATLRLRVQARLVDTVWFRSVLLLALGGGIGGVAWRLARYRHAQQVDRFRREQELAAERARLATVLEMTSDFVGFASPDGQLWFVNEAGRRMVGLTATEELDRLHYRVLFPPDQAERMEQEVVPAARRDGLWSGESVLLHRDGRMVPVSQVVVAHRNKEGELDYLSTIARDISERKRAEASLLELNAGLDRRVQDRTGELQRANLELEAFVYSVSHDLRGPVRNVTGFLELLGLRYRSTLDDEGRRYVHTATVEARRMSQLIDDLLELSRVGRGGLHMAAVSLRELVEEVRAEVAGAGGQRQIEWRIDELPVVAGDRALLRQVWINLLGNALKFTRHRTVAEIHIGTGPSPLADRGQIAIFVRDNGAGFNAEYTAKLFGAFERLHSQREFEGTGVGLAIVKRIVERHGGKVGAEGKVEQGATFWFSLPLATAAAQAGIAGPAPGASAR